jgi:hypothetical protein
MLLALALVAPTCDRQLRASLLMCRAAFAAVRGALPSLFARPQF